VRLIKISGNDEISSVAKVEAEEKEEGAEVALLATPELLEDGTLLVVTNDTEVEALDDEDDELDDDGDDAEDSEDEAEEADLA
jgi:DNA gyrase subunit A